MWKVLWRARRSFARDQCGHAAILFAFSAIPLVGLLGGAVDLTRHTRYKTQILNAMDSAAVALTRHGAKNDEDADRFVNEFIAAMLPQYVSAGDNGNAARPRDPMLQLPAFDAEAIEGGFRVSLNASMGTTFMPVIGIAELPLVLQSEIMMTGGKYEVALVLDNTGSMREHGRIGALRDAASHLVDKMYDEDGAESRVKMALVPFVTAVNIKTPGVFDPSWINPAPHPDDQAFNFNFSGGKDGPVDRLKLFDAMGVAWKGCVEARGGSYDEDDTAPTTGATKWVPYLWPDEPDKGGYGNSYLADRTGGRDLDRLRDVAKYSARPDANTISKGPNAACPRPLVELTDDQDRMRDEIRKMVPHNTTGSNNSGTNVAEGLMWGWRVLSPEQPFDQGAPYGDKETQKVLVLLSDGRNWIIGNEAATESDYTSYGYLAAGRLGSTNDYRVAERAVDEKVRRACEKIKSKGIRVYTILFQVDFEHTKQLFRDCASKGDDGKPLYHYVPAASELETAFARIGEDLTSIRISR